MSGENNFNLLLRSALAASGATYQRIEDKCSVGIPDYNVCHKGVDFWIEAKFCIQPSRASTPVNISFRPYQLPWMRERIKNGGVCFVLIRCGSNTFMLGKQAIVSGYFNMPMKRLRAVTLAYGKTQYVIEEAINLAHYINDTGDE